ncbi:sugar nucleotide-binding protein [Alphaproteobacteria bacterium]|nr:sugar nucleotide-binding protein [Alphaproteobacteria bacterium]
MKLGFENVLILGAYGRLGVQLSRFLENTHNVIRVGRNKDSAVIIKDFTIKTIEELLLIYNVKILINLIAATNVDDCDNYPDEAFLANSIIPHYISNAVNRLDRDVFVLHISTDQVYSGKTLHKEEDINPCNVYGVSKLSGELFIANSKNVCILRTNYFGLSHAVNNESYLDWLVSSIIAKRQISVFQNVFFTPVGCRSLCFMILRLIKKKLLGTYNFGSCRALSKAEFAEIVAKKLGVDNPKFIYSDYVSNSNIKRPLDMTMESKKLLTELLFDPIVVEDDISYELGDLYSKIK